VSKMFDSLRRAEAARKRKLAGPSPVPDKPTIDPSPALEPVIPDPVQISGFPEGFLRELGILKNSLESALGKSGKRSILFAGSVRGEGTTTLVASFAKVLSLQTREKILLVEMNGRRPTLQRKLGLQSTLGITHFLDGSRPLDAVVQGTPQGSFDVAQVGEHDPVKIQLHLSRMFPVLLDNAFQRYDVVLIDAPPIIGSPETPPMSGLTDGVVVVVHCGRTKREVVQRSLNMIGQFEANVLGLVLNRKKYYIPDFIYRRL
jgi:Mrp family chromosome partitioning ATPase